MSDDPEFEFHRWPPEPRGGQHTTNLAVGVLAIHKSTGIAVVEESERAQLNNLLKAREKLSGVVHAYTEWSRNG